MRPERYAEKTYDVVVVGGGMAGVCAAIAAAREGARTALIHDRPVLGGNASGEIRIHISGADQSLRQPDFAEAGLLYELMLENKSRNDTYCWSIWDMVLYEAAHKEPNLTCYLNTVMYDVCMEQNTVRAVLCVQSTTEMHYRISGKIFVDSTGNGSLGYYAGADFKTGSEAKSETGEPDAPDTPNNDRMGNTILLKARDMGHPVSFTPPAFAKKLSEHQLRNRIHCAQMKHTIDLSSLPDPEEYRRTSMTSSSCSDYGYWWLELMGEGDDIVPEYEKIRDDLYAYCYGLWDHIKNNKEGVHRHNAENFELEWVGALPGMRESRRFVGDYALSENDILEHRRFEDAVCYGGWCVDRHAPHGLLDDGLLPSDCFNFHGVYTIPYRCYYSRNIGNLFFAGRDISTTRLGLASTRIIGCCAIGGEAVGRAAAMCVRYGCDPRGLAREGHIPELQQKILREDGYLPDVRNTDPLDLARGATVTASSYRKGGEPDNVLNGVNRRIGEDFNGWLSDGMAAGGETLSLAFPKEETLREVQLTFWSDFKYPIRITMAPNRQRQQRTGVPAELVRDYTLVLYRGDEAVRRVQVRDNHQRRNKITFEPTACDRVDIVVEKTNGCENAAIFEVRAYG